MLQPSILVVDDHQLLRLGMRSTLNALGLDSTPMLEAESLKDALNLYRQHQHDTGLVILDLNLPDSKGLSGLQTFKQQFPAARIVVLSGTVDPAIAQEAQELGAEGFFPKSGDLGKLTSTLLRAVRPSPTPARPHAPLRHHSEGMRLSERELEILELVLQGKTNQEIVERTDLRLGTVKNYISGLFVVFNVSSRSKLISLFR
ncbi:MAG: response regulator transcription factor [Hydrogenophaga sp.]|jgi:DNA-binding NarL/FixJ family response regulator|uniref:response regulator transcription factor n=1 Tax=Hydrogenophaga sp. TaxID=1904254 RepID=UPI002725EBC2|nr:response regulator transcription factor [Hydrogenophaga sp.]MDO9571354.1 response regulator transcription factor [Hydrogenophaga sp.]MDP1893802.1 response regulator transcription factor [Hydrogenophaga sp.]MDP3376163.1 response regulator transcription factor [Hydrogenophaga sp.]MDP3924562.1 response regulator transcription factor [Hydrogenophaga sp.]MDZ4239641.1 response regulator transcription factor [Hydrogenophaga sp.]